MKKIYLSLGCALGGLMIGLFANFLSTVWGCVAFGLGVGLLVYSIVRLCGENEE